MSKAMWKMWRHGAMLAQNLGSAFRCWWGDRSFRARYLDIEWRRRNGQHVDVTEEWELEEWD